MPEVTFETFRAAAQEAVTNLEDEADTEPDARTVLRDKIRNILVSDKGLSDEEAREMLAGKVADRLQKMLFPKEEKEIKDKAAEMVLEKKAIRKFLAMILEDENA